MLKTPSDVRKVKKPSKLETQISNLKFPVSFCRVTLYKENKERKSWTHVVENVDLSVHQDIFNQGKYTIYISDANRNVYYQNNFSKNTKLVPLSDIFGYWSQSYHGANYGCSFPSSWFLEKCINQINAISRIVPFEAEDYLQHGSVEDSSRSNYSQKFREKEKQTDDSLSPRNNQVQNVYSHLKQKISSQLTCKENLDDCKFSRKSVQTYDPMKFYPLKNLRHWNQSEEEEKQLNQIEQENACLYILVEEACQKNQVMEVVVIELKKKIDRKKQELKKIEFHANWYRKQIILCEKTKSDLEKKQKEIADLGVRFHGKPYLVREENRELRKKIMLLENTMGRKDDEIRRLRHQKGKGEIVLKCAQMKSELRDVNKQTKSINVQNEKIEKILFEVSKGLSHSIGDMIKLVDMFKLSTQKVIWSQSDLGRNEAEHIVHNENDQEITPQDEKQRQFNRIKRYTLKMDAGENSSINNDNQIRQDFSNVWGGSMNNSRSKQLASKQLSRSNQTSPSHFERKSHSDSNQDPNKDLAIANTQTEGFAATLYRDLMQYPITYYQDSTEQMKTASKRCSKSSSRKN